MKIYNQQGRILYEGQVEDNSYASDAIMDDNSLTLYIKTTEPLELPVGAYCTFENQKYTLMRPESFKKNNSRNFSYTVTMESEAAKAKIWKFRNPVDGRLQFSLTAKPIEHLQMVVDNLNRRDGGWSVGQCIDDVEHTITYDHNYIIDALVAQATEFNTEYEFKGKVVNLRKVEYNKNNPLPLSYGRGNGFKTGVGRSNQNESMPVEILYVQGGTQNIDPSKYGHKELLLPEGGEIAYDGQYFEDEEGFNEKTARHYIVSEDRLSIRRDDGVLSTLAEDSLDCSEVYPKREGLVSEVITVDAEKNFYDFTDSSIPSTLNFEDHLIEGEKMTVIFQSGMLAGREFEVKYYHDAQDGKLGRRFEIVPQEIDGETMPNETFKPSKDDRYAVFNCTLPDEYMNDKEHKQGAEWDMFRTAVKYKYENEDQKFTFTGTLDGIWSKKDWINIGGRIILGGYISFSDNQFQKEGVNVRITAVKKYINNPHSPEITLSNSTVTGSVTGTLNELQAQEVVIQETRREAIQYTKRRFRDAQETSEMLRALIDVSVDSLTQQFTEGITPISIQTMQMLVGDESLQFRYVNSDKNPQPVGDGITYDTEMKQLHAPERIVQHMTLGISTISSSHDESEYKFWRVAEYNSAVLEDADKKYYLYIKAAENGTGSYTLSEKALDFKEGTTYNLLVGVLNSEYDGVRSFATLYGFTEILPSRITTDKIVSPDGNTYFDVSNGEIGGNIKIKAGSTGYENLEDKPDLSIYATNSELDILDDRISAQVTRVDNLTNRIDTAGWITTANANKLYASKTLENGQTIISYINQTAGSTTIHSSKINLQGAVSFTSLNSSLQNTINGKANSSSLGSLAYKNQVAKDLLSADLSSLINGKADSSDLGALAYKEAVEAAQLGSTIIVGGYLNTDYIKVKRIDANGAKVGGFTIDSGRLWWKGYDYFGGDSRSLKLGVSQTSTEGIVDVNFNAATTGRFGVKAVGSNVGGAAIYASTGTLTYPGDSMTYAGFFVGPTSVRGELDSDYCASKGFRFITGRNSNGTYTYNEGVNWGNGAAQNPDLDKIRLIVRGGIIVGYTGE